MPKTVDILRPQLFKFGLNLKHVLWGGDKISTFKGVTLDSERFKVAYNGVPVELPAKEFALLHTLMQNKNIVMSRNTLLENVWGYDYVGETNIVDVYVRYIRQKLDEKFGVKLITTVRGVGYVIKED